MTFEPAGKYLFKAAKHFHLQEQALAGIMCECARKVIQEHFKDFQECWEPLTFESHTLTIKANHSAASSQLFMQQTLLLQRLQESETPGTIRELKIVTK